MGYIGKTSDLQLKQVACTFKRLLPLSRGLFT